MQDVEKDLGTKLDWVAVDHWNTDNPHVHVLIRGRADDGQDLVISRDYISRGFRDRAAERVTLELGPRSEQEIRTALEKEVEAERWTSLDRALRDISDECGGVADLRPGPNAEDPELRRLLLGRAAKLERLGLAEPVGPACWTLKPGLDQTLRQLGIRGDIIKTMHQAMSADGREPDVSGFALHGEEPSDPVLGRLVKRGLDDELKGIGLRDRRRRRRTHPPSQVLRSRDDRRRAAGAPSSRRGPMTTPTVGAACRSPRAPISRSRRRLRRPARPGSTASFSPRTRRSAAAGSAPRCATRWRRASTIWPRKAWRAGKASAWCLPAISSTLCAGGSWRMRRRSCRPRRASPTSLSTEGEHVSGVYRQRMTLASGRFAMIDDGLGFQLVPWRPALEKELGRHVRGVMAPGGNVEWSFGRNRGLGL